MKMLPSKSDDWYDVMTDCGDIYVVGGAQWVAYYRRICGCKDAFVDRPLSEAIDGARCIKQQKCNDCKEPT